MTTKSMLGVDGSGGRPALPRRSWRNPTVFVTALALGSLFLVQEFAVADQVGVGPGRGLWMLLYDALAGVALLVGYRVGAGLQRWCGSPKRSARWPLGAAHLGMGAVGALAVGAFGVLATTSTTVDRWPFDPCPAGSPLYPTAMGCGSGTGGWAVLAAAMAVMVGGYGLAATTAGTAAGTTGRAGRVRMGSPLVPAAAAALGTLLMVGSGMRLAPGDRSDLWPAGGPSPIGPDPLVVARASDIRVGMVPLVVGITLLALSADIFHRRSGVSWPRVAVIAFSTFSAGLLLCVLWIGAAASPAD